MIVVGIPLNLNKLTKLVSISKFNSLELQLLSESIDLKSKIHEGE